MHALISHKLVADRRVHRVLSSLCGVVGHKPRKTRHQVFAMISVSTAGSVSRCSQARDWLITKSPASVTGSRGRRAGPAAEGQGFFSGIGRKVAPRDPRKPFQRSGQQDVHCGLPSTGLRDRPTYTALFGRPGFVASLITLPNVQLPCGRTGQRLTLDFVDDRWGLSLRAWRETPTIGCHCPSDVLRASHLLRLAVFEQRPGHNNTRIRRIPEFNASSLGEAFGEYVVRAQ